MNIVFALGNGTSRLQLPIDRLKHHATIIGCNRSYRDQPLDAVCAVDQPMILETIEKSSVPVFIDSRHSTRYDKATVLDTSQYKLIDSGTLALIAACYLKADHVFMLGYDYISFSGEINNVFAGEPNYDRVCDLHVDRSVIEHWQDNHSLVMQNNPDTQFFRINMNAYVPNIVEPNFHNITEQQFIDTFI